MQEVCYLFTLYIPACLSRRTHEGPVPLHEAKIPPAKPPQPQRRQANATTPHYSVHMYIMLALWIHHQTERKPSPQGKARRRHPQDQHHGTGPPTRATPRGQPRQENQAKPRAQGNPDPKPARPHLPLYTKKGLMHKAYSFIIEEAEFQEGSQEAHSKETPPRGHTLKKRG